MTSPIPLVLVDHQPGGTLSNGSPSGLGSRTTYRAGYTTNGIDKVAVGHEYDHPRKAGQYADLVVAKLKEQQA